MSEHAHEDHSAHYKKIFIKLVIAFLISFIGPFIGEAIGAFWLTLLTAFGVAFYKARLVIVHFMHLPQEKNYVSYILQTTLVLIAIFVAGVMVDVLNHEGQNWDNVAAKQAVEAGLKSAEGAEHH